MSLNPAIINIYFNSASFEGQSAFTCSENSESSTFEGFFLAQKLRFGLRISSRDSTKISGRNAMI